MFGSAIIVFRETLEAALLIGIIAAATRGLSGRNLWLAIGMGAGLAGSLVVAGLTGTIAEMAEGAGQELFNAAILGIAVLMLGWHNIWMATHGREMAAQAKSVGLAVKSGQREMSALAILIALAVLREGSETALFLYGLAASDGSSRVSLLSGGLLGLAAGIAAGWALYSGLSRIPLRHFFTVTSVLILFLAAGMAGQMARLLIQGDIIRPLASPLWDSSSLLPMDSFAGNLLHLFAGYEARPSGMQVLFYTLTFLIILAGMRWNRPRPRQATAT
ncbi:MAG: iron permease [Thiobacillus sp. 63-78]|uniref:FTR1 family iron permease n=1 Tax=Thiobacillus sp. 63-78 TaxID=1895859 RepID=UPI000868B4CC|nr:FTR1 family protein [Thiobacillus sp. 63-78]MBN8764375.1 FTR1 family protein [Thiobacillus sp.]ODV13008.1 MAG: iron permease [Thiobacillus sp. SCN 64-317]MBN8767120.1 FTR1 family protein [Thiobacillus sp.]MBN8774324.1 FTR1 family protein [Thiobacillus sp.]OJZ16262.1 MAG: iron permease [Thiobacillus sp. 63-78]